MGFSSCLIAIAKLLLPLGTHSLSHCVSDVILKGKKKPGSLHPLSRLTLLSLSCKLRTGHFICALVLLCPATSSPNPLSPSSLHPSRKPLLTTSAQPGLSFLRPPSDLGAKFSKQCFSRHSFSAFSFSLPAARSQGTWRLLSLSLQRSQGCCVHEYQWQLHQPP